MTLLLDTSVMIDLSLNNKITIAEFALLREQYQGMPAISFITYAEFYEGLLHKNDINKKKFLAFAQLFPLLLPTKRTAAMLAELKVLYEDQGKKISMADLFIATQAIENRCVLVTKDRRFSQIKELRLALLAE